MYYRRSQELTEKEKKYLEHFWFKKGSQVAGAMRVLTFLTIFMMLWPVLFAWTSGPEHIKESLMFALSIGGLLAMAWGIRAIRVNWDKKRYASILNGNYEVRRTTIKFIDYHDVGTTRGGYMRFPVYFCEGISEPVSPISEKLYKLAKEGDEVTVVMDESQNIFLGITFHEKYDKKLGVE